MKNLSKAISISIMSITFHSYKIKIAFRYWTSKTTYSCYTHRGNLTLCEKILEKNICFTFHREAVIIYRWGCLNQGGEVGTGRSQFLLVQTDHVTSKAGKIRHLLTVCLTKVHMIVWNPNGIPTRSMENMKWYSSSQVLTAKHVSYPQLTVTQPGKLPGPTHWLIS